MERQIERGCELDVHRDTVAACVRVPGRGRPREQHVRTFGTTAAELLQLRAWFEIGVDMTRFPSEHHLASWAGLCPGNNESAGKHKAGTTRKGDRWLRLALVEAALAAIRTKGSAFGARYRRVMRHRGHKKAVVAVAHAMLRAAYHVLAEGTAYRDPGPDYYDRRRARQATRRAVEVLERQRYRVTLDPAA